MDWGARAYLKINIINRLGVFTLDVSVKFKSRGLHILVNFYLTVSLSFIIYKCDRKMLRKTLMQFAENIYRHISNINRCVDTSTENRQLWIDKIKEYRYLLYRAYREYRGEEYIGYRGRNTLDTGGEIHWIQREGYIGYREGYLRYKGDTGIQGIPRIQGMEHIKIIQIKLPVP